MALPGLFPGIQVSVPSHRDGTFSLHPRALFAFILLGVTDCMRLVPRGITDMFSTYILILGVSPPWLLGCRLCSVVPGPSAGLNVGVVMPSAGLRAQSV